MLVQIQTALDDRLNTLPGDKAWEGVIYYPTIGKPYVSTKIAARQRQVMGIGPNVPQIWYGTYQLVVCHPAMEGVAAAYATADSLLALFPRGLSLTAGASAVIVESASVGPTYTMGDWINVPVTVQWFCEDR